MKIYIICPVRGVSDEKQSVIDSYASGMEDDGHEVHNPKYAVEQDDDTGYGICKGHLEGMRSCDEVVVFYDETSKGSFFDLGMAYALDKPIFFEEFFTEKPSTKCYPLAMEEYTKREHS